MNWHRNAYRFFFTFAITGFAPATYKHDAAILSIDFVFLLLAWMYREMYLGWNQEKRSWKFIKRPEARP
jgi:hypothetical protein